MARAIQACVHCGFCLPACPTYQLLGQEMDSPRGRIYLMKGVLEGALRPEEVALHVDRCLGCLACVSACPSDVRYDQLLTLFRQHPLAGGRSPAGRRWLRRALLAVLPYPSRFRWAAALGRWARGLGLPWPGQLRAMLGLLPDRLPAGRTLPAVFPAVGARRARVALLAGCVQQVLAPGIAEATLRVLSYHGVEVWVPPGQGCCGALAMHTGEGALARRLAARNLAAFDLSAVDAVVSTAAGCGSAMREYPLLFSGGSQQRQAAQMAERVRDVSQFLVELGAMEPGPLPGESLGLAGDRPLRVAYHEACHLAHGLGVRQAPRQLLSAIPNVELVEIPDGGLCCGSAGTYNLEQPHLAGELQRRKVEAILASGAHLVATGNIGCMVQIARGLERAGSRLPVLHTVELLDLAYRQPSPAPEAGAEVLAR